MPAENTPVIPSGTEPENTTVVPSGTETETKQFSPEQVAAYEKKLSDEAAKWRKQAKELQTELDTLKASTGTTPPDEDKGEIAKLTRSINELQTTVKQLEVEKKNAANRAMQKIHQAGLASVVASANLTEPQTAMKLLAEVSKVADDDTVVFTVKGEDGQPTEVEATAENLRKYGLLPAIYFPADGVTGTGSRPPKPSPTTTVDLKRAATDSKYYQENRTAILAERARLARQR
jgi:hypothetical protein